LTKSYNRFRHNLGDFKGKARSFPHKKRKKRRRPHEGYSIDDKHQSLTINDGSKEDLILSGKVHLIHISSSSKKKVTGSDYEGFKAIFCRLDWSRYKKDPSSLPMFRLLVKRSCKNDDIYTYDLKKIVELAIAMDKNDSNSTVHVMKPNGFVFHESRCGSTLVANALTVMDPIEHRVYSESGPPMSASKACGKIGKSGKSCQLLRDVVYMMGRTGDPNEQRMFFKIQSSGTNYIDVMKATFPDIPWIFVYREPVQIMMSHLKRKTERSNCVRHMAHYAMPKKTLEFLATIGRDVGGLSSVEKCALHLSNLCNAAILAINRSEGMGKAINYENIVDKLITNIIPHHFKVPVVEERRKRIIEISGLYSKGKQHRGGEWKDDSEAKNEMASSEIREASKTFLYPSYDSLQN